MEYYLVIRLENLEYYRKNNRIDIKEIFITDKDKKLSCKTDNFDDLFKWIKKNVTEKSEIRIYTDKGMHSLLPWMYNHIGKSALRTRFGAGHKLWNIGWYREKYNQNKKREKYTINFNDISKAYPTIKIDPKGTVEEEVDTILNFIDRYPKAVFSNTMNQTISTRAYNTWKKDNPVVKDMHKWLKEWNGEYDAKGNEILVPMDDVWAETKKAYNGGFLWANPKHQMKIIEKPLYQYDMTSMYASIMGRFKHPVGAPIFEEGVADIEKCTYRMYKVYIEEAEALSIPFIQIDTKTSVTGVYMNLKGDERGNILKDKEKLKYLKNVTVNMNNYTFELFEKWYKGKWSKEFMYACKEEFDIFKTYLDELNHWKELFNNDKEIRNSIKQMIVAPYGKSAQVRTSYGTTVDLEEDITEEIITTEWGNEYINGREIIRNDGLIYYMEDVDSEAISYIPLAQSISSKSEIVILEYLLDDPDSVYYIDTDGFITDKMRHDLPMDTNKTGYFRLDGWYNRGVIRGPKHYYLTHTRGVHTLKGSGLQTQYFGPKNMPLEEYVKDEVIFPYGRYGRTVVDGGVIEFLDDLTLVDQRKPYNYKPVPKVEAPKQVQLKKWEEEELQREFLEKLYG